MEKEPLISIIIVTFNAAKTLQKALDSIFEQQYPHIETIIIDGLSTDNTVEILKANDHKITFWKSEKDNGIYDAMNKALNFAKGDRIFFLGADDYLLPDFSKIINLFKNDKIIYTGLVKFNEKLLGRQISSYSLSKSNVIHQSIFYPKSVFKLFRYNTNYPIYADYYLNIQCFKNYKFKFISIPVSVFADGGISSRKIDVNFNQDKSKIVSACLPKITYWRFIYREFKKKLVLN